MEQNSWHKMPFCTSSFNVRRLTRSCQHDWSWIREVPEKDQRSTTLRRYCTVYRDLIVISRNRKMITLSWNASNGLFFLLLACLLSFFLPAACCPALRCNLGFQKSKPIKNLEIMWANNRFDSRFFIKISACLHLLLVVPTGYRQTNWYFHGTLGSFNACIFTNRQILPNKADKTQEVIYFY